METAINRAGYLRESYHYFHLKDTAGQELDFHFHEFDKLIILISGKVDYRVESSSYELRPWDVLLVGHHTIHKAEIDKSVPYERIIIYLDRGHFERSMPGAGLFDSFDLADKRSRHLLTPNAEQIDALKAAIAAYERAAGDELFGAQTLRETLIIQLLIQINRLAEAEEPRAGQSGYDAKIQQALSYINENFRKELTVDAACRAVFLSRYHFMQPFQGSDRQHGACVYTAETAHERRAAHPRGRDAGQGRRRERLCGLLRVSPRLPRELRHKPRKACGEKIAVNQGFQRLLLDACRGESNKHPDTGTERLRGKMHLRERGQRRRIKTRQTPCRCALRAAAGCFLF